MILSYFSFFLLPRRGGCGICYESYLLTFFSFSIVSIPFFLLSINTEYLHANFYHSIYAKVYRNTKHSFNDSRLNIFCLRYENCFFFTFPLSFYFVFMHQFQICWLITVFWLNVQNQQSRNQRNNREIKNDGKLCCVEKIEMENIIFVILNR